ncbi:hypothetical protein ACFXPX_27070 [Kitasatospora sp. NPDC059146]|uniref:hypothetical protein n=1 Tax=Kitasatospora sp. NPDC059146 TaxID=3346741 RepID=UPI0036AC9A8C
MSLLVAGPRSGPLDGTETVCCEAGVDAGHRQDVGAAGRGRQRSGSDTSSGPPAGYRDGRHRRADFALWRAASSSAPLSTANLGQGGAMMMTKKATAPCQAHGANGWGNCPVAELRTGQTRLVALLEQYADGPLNLDYRFSPDKTTQRVLRPGCFERSCRLIMC